MIDLKLRLSVDDIKKLDLSVLPPKVKIKIEQYLRSVPESTEALDVYFNVSENTDASLAQLAKVHFLIRQLSQFTGHSVEEVKLLIKERIDFINENNSPKSFKDASKRELSEAIQECIKLGLLVGLDLS